MFSSATGLCMARCRRTDLPHPKMMLLLLQKDLLNGVLSEKKSKPSLKRTVHDANKL